MATTAKLKRRLSGMTTVLEDLTLVSEAGSGALGILRAGGIDSLKTYLPSLGTPGVKSLFLT